MLFASDTSPEARRILLEILRRQTPERRLQIALAATEAAREMIRADLRERFPVASADELHEHFLVRWLGPGLAAPVIAHRRARGHRPEHVRPLIGALSPRFYVSEQAMLEALAERRAFNVIDPDTGMKADCFVRGTSAFDLEEFSRRRLRVVSAEPGLELQVKSPEDSILRKLQLFRDGGGVSDQQWRDVLGVLAVNAGALEEAYLDRWAAALGLADLLAGARAEAAR